jgi:hypothetical protein
MPLGMGPACQRYWLLIFFSSCESVIPGIGKNMQIQENRQNEKVPIIGKAEVRDTVTPYFSNIV